MLSISVGGGTGKDGRGWGLSFFFTCLAQKSHNDGTTWNDDPSLNAIMETIDLGRFSVLQQNWHAIDSCLPLRETLSHLRLPWLVVVLVMYVVTVLNSSKQDTRATSEKWIGTRRTQAYSGMSELVGNLSFVSYLTTTYFPRGHWALCGLSRPLKGTSSGTLERRYDPTNDASFRPSCDTSPVHQSVASSTNFPRHTAKGDSTNRARSSTTTTMS